MSDLNPILLTLLRAGEAAPDLAALDWDALLPAAQRQGVAPLLYYRLQAAGQVQHLPAGAAQTLHLAFHRQWGKNQVRMQTLEHVLGLLAAIDIHPIALKGAGLVLTVYDELAVRPMDDVDLLVAPEEFRPALQQLLAHGGLVTHAEPFEGAYELVSHHVALRFPAVSAVVVELHHQWLSLPVRQASLVAMAELRGRAQTVALGSQAVDVLGAEDQVLHLCGHLAIHSAVMQRLIWSYDIDQVIRRAGPGLDWEAIAPRAQRYQMVWPLRQVLASVAATFATPVPAAVQARLAALPVSEAERQRYGVDAWGPHSRLGDGAQKLAGLPDAASRLRFAWRLAFPARAFMRRQHPADGPLRLAARYPARWLAVLREYAALRGR